MEKESLQLNWWHHNIWKGNHTTSTTTTHNNRFQGWDSWSFTISWKRRKPSPNCVQVTCNTSSAYHVHVVLRATWYEETAQLLSLTESKSHLFEHYFIGWTINRWRMKDQHMLHNISLQTSQGCLWNNTSVGLAEHRLPLTLEGIVLATCFLHMSFLQTISALMRPSLFMSRIFPKPFSGSSLQSCRPGVSRDVCCACQSACLFHQEAVSYWLMECS